MRLNLNIAQRIILILYCAPMALTAFAAPNGVRLYESAYVAMAQVAIIVVCLSLMLVALLLAFSSRKPTAGSHQG